MSTLEEYLNDTSILSTSLVREEDIPAFKHPARAIVEYTLWQEGFSPIVAGSLALVVIKNLLDSKHLKSV